MDNNIPLTIFWFRRDLRLKMAGNVGGWQWAAGWGTREIALKIYSGFSISLRGRRKLKSRCHADLFRHPTGHSLLSGLRLVCCKLFPSLLAHDLVVFLKATSLGRVQMQHHISGYLILMLKPKSLTRKLKYIKKWVPEYADFSKYPKPIVDHVFARERCLKVFKEALAK